MSDVKISKIKEELMSKAEYRFDDLVKIMQVLRSDEGCMWDREQDHKSIRSNFIEETYEVIEAIDTEDEKLLREELGDVMLQVVFHARMEEEKGVFGIDDVCSDICKKLIHRHPHVFGTVEVKDSKEVLDVWNAVKNDEKQRVTVTDKLKAIPPMLPALMRDEKVGKKAKCFDFADAESVRVKLSEELAEVDAAIATKDHDAIEEEIGDLLLTVTSLCRKLDVDSELALTKATEKFIYRFETLEREAGARGVDVNTASMTELDKIWDEIKHKNM